MIARLTFRAISAHPIMPNRISVSAMLIIVTFLRREGPVSVCVCEL
uniref:Uncharacterized protein MANES_02G186900 n=1 Tax=Rhizophora mucronata TaxID=61149 RepID=A0A2P2IQP7_RHIMU